MADISELDNGDVLISDAGQVLRYSSYQVTTPDGTTIVHESRGGTLSAAAAVSVGSAFVEISYLGDGPRGGELVMVVSAPDELPQVFLGALVPAERPHPSEVPSTWPPAVDLALGLVADTTHDSGTKEELEEFLQFLIGAVHG